MADWAFASETPVKGFLHFRCRYPTEENPLRLFLADQAHQFVHGAIHGNEDEQNDLDGPEMRPDNFRLWGFGGFSLSIVVPGTKP